MQIDVKRLIALKKFTGSFQFDYVPPEDMCIIPLCKIEGGVKVSGDYEIYDDDSVGVKFSVKYRIEGQCSYCLNEAKKDVEEQFDVLFVPKDDSENYVYDGNTVDLGLAVREAILFSQPNILLCRKDCAGIDANNERKRGG